MRSASGVASPPRATSGIPVAASASTPSGQALLPPRRRSTTRSARAARAATSGTGRRAGLAVRYAAPDAAAARSSVSAVETKRILCTHRYCHAGRQQTRGALAARVQQEPGHVQDPGRTLTGMNNMYGTPAGTPGPVGSPSPSGPSREQPMLRWGVGVTLAGCLAGGGTAWAVSSSGSPAAGTSGTSATTSTAGAALTGNAAVLNSALNTEASGTATLPRLRWALARLRAIGGVDGEITFHNKTGYHTLAFERGTITSLSGSDVVVRAPNGVTSTWLIVSDTVVRHNGTKTTTGALATGQA